METTLERSSPHYHLDQNQIQACIDQYASQANLKNFILASSGLGNTNYIVTLEDDQKLILRVHVGDKLEKGLKEYQLSKLLAFSSFVPKVLFFKPAQNDNFSFSIVEYIEGRVLSQISWRNQVDLEKVYFEFGNFLSQLRNIKFNAIGLLGENLEVVPIKTKNTKFHPVINFILDCLENEYLVKRIEKEVIAKLRNLAVSNELLLQTTKEKPHLVHGDFKIENILIKSTGNEIQLTGILDWEYARADTTYGDIATLFRGDYEQTSLKKCAFLNGFESGGGKLIAHWDKVSKIIDLINLCHFLCSREEKPSLHKIALKELEDTIAIFN